MQLFKLFGTIAINNSEANKALEETSDKGNHAERKLSSAFKKIGAAVATYLTVDAIVNFGKGCITAAADANAMASQFSQVFGELEGQASQSLSKIADNAGIAENRMKGSFTKIAAFAKTTGMDTESALALSERAMIAVADSAAFYDRSLEETTESLQSFLKGNFENDAALGLSCTEVTRNAAANKLYGKSFKDLSEEQKQLTLLQMVEDANALSGALGQAARESETWTNVTGNLKQSWTDFQAALGKHVLPMFTGLVSNLSGFVETVTTKVDPAVQWLTEKFQTLKTWLGDIGTYTANQFKPAIEELSTAFNTVKEAVQPIIDKLVEYVTSGQGAEDATNFLKDAISFLADAVNFLIDGFKQLREKLQPLVSAIGDKLANAVNTARDGFGQFVDFAGRLWENLQPLVSLIGDNLLSAFEGLKEPLSSIKESFGDLWAVITDKIIPILGGALAGAIGIAIGLFNGIVSAVSGFADALAGCVQIVTGVIQAIVGVFTGDGEMILQAADNIGEGIIAVFGGLWDACCGFVEGFVDGVIGFFEGLWDTLVGHSIVPDTIDGIATCFGELWGKVSGFVSDFCGNVTSKFTELKDGAVEKFGELKDKAVEKFGQLKESAGEKWESLKSTVSEKASTMKDKATTAFSTLKDKTSSLFGSAKEKATSAFSELKAKVTGDAGSAESTAGSKFSSLQSKVANSVNKARDAAKTAFSVIKDSISSGVSGAATSVSDKFGSILSKVKDVMTQCRDFVSSGISRIANLFSSANWSLPKIKLPHFSISGGFSLNPPSVPKFSIEWYKKAYDQAMVLSDPTIFGYNPATGKAMGGGDGNGNEIVSGESHLMNLIGNVVEGKTAEQNERIISVLVAILEAITGGNKELLRALLAGHVIKLNEREVGRTVREYA